MTSTSDPALDEELSLAIRAIPGWFDRVDQCVFDCLLRWQHTTNVRGDLVELGCYLGKSAVLLGRYVRSGEKLTVCDLFGEPAPDPATTAECASSYPDLGRAGFETNYLRCHPVLPEILQSDTAAVVEHVPASSCRLVHVDASHQYRNTRTDITTARTLLHPDGIAVFDDFRSIHTPGVAAAVWEAVLRDGLHPICVTPFKLYGTWGDPGPAQAELTRWAAALPRHTTERHDVAGHPLLRVVDLEGFNPALLPDG